jgi:hypothetical protein
MWTLALAAILAPLAVPAPAAPVAVGAQPRTWLDSSMGLLQAELTARYGPDQRLRLRRGLAQVARFWQSGDGGAGEFEAFVREQFVGGGAALDQLCARLEPVVADLVRPGPAPGPPPGLPVDRLLFAPGAALTEAAFARQLAFAVLLNFPLTSPEERLRLGDTWTDRQWAEARLAEPFGRRIPARLDQAAATASAAARAASALPVPAAELRAELRREYGHGAAGLERQRALQAALERGVGGPQSAGAEHYRPLLGVFQAHRDLDACSPAAPTRLDRAFREDRQLPEARVRQMLETVSDSPLAGRVAERLQARLGRALEPFDLWCDPRPEGAPRGAAPGPDPAPGPGCLPGPGPDPAGRGPIQACVHPGAPHPILAGLPGPAFRLALDQVARDRSAQAPADALAVFWAAWERSGAALVELAVWRWLYAHPGAGPGELAQAVQTLARERWNRSYAPVLGQPDCLLLASRAGLVAGDLGLADAAMAPMIACQLRTQARRPEDLGPALRRWTGLGRLTPDLWLRRAGCGTLGPEALLAATAAALERP